LHLPNLSSLGVFRLAQSAIGNNRSRRSASGCTGPAISGRLARDRSVADEEAVVRPMDDDSIRVDLEHSAISADLKFLPVGANTHEGGWINVKHSVAAEMIY